MHNPVGLEAMRSSAFVEDESLPHADPPAVAVNHLVTASCLPESGGGCSVSTRPSWVLFVLVAEEIPVVLWGGSDFTFLCRITNFIN